MTNLSSNYVLSRSRLIIFILFVHFLVYASATAQTCSSINIVRQPTSFDAWTGYSGTANNFSIYATSTGGALIYQWERSTDNGANWTPVAANLDAGTTYSSFNAATLYYTNSSGSITALDGFKYRVKVSNSTCFTYSNVVTLRVFGPTFYTGLFLPATTNYCSPSPTLSVQLKSSTNSSLTAFSWERRVGSSGSWVTITSSNATTLDAGMAYTNFNTANLRIDGVTSSAQSFQYRCRVTISVVSKNVIQTSSGSTTNSNTNTINGVYSPITSLAPPADAQIAINSVTTNCPRITISATISNTGSYLLPAGTSVAVYDANPTSGAANLIGTYQTTVSIATGASLTVTMTANLVASSTNVFVVVNDKGTTARPFNLSSWTPNTDINECSYSNNIDSETFACLNTDGDSIVDFFDIDDDNDGVLDSDENCELPNLLTSDGSFENLISVASSDAFNSNVVNRQHKVDRI